LTANKINKALVDAGVSVLGRTIRRRLVSAGLRAHIPRKKPFLNVTQCQKGQNGQKNTSMCWPCSLAVEIHIICRVPESNENEWKITTAHMQNAVALQRYGSCIYDEWHYCCLVYTGNFVNERSDALVIGTLRLCKSKMFACLKPFSCSGRRGNCRAF